MKHPQKIAKEAIISFLSMSFGSGFRYLFVLILARWVGPTYLGIYSLANAIMRFAEVIGKAGLDNGVIKYVSENFGSNSLNKGKEIIISAIKMGFILSILTSLILIIISSWLAHDLFSGGELLKRVLIYNACALPFSVIMIIIASATQSFKLLKYKSFVINIFVPLISLISMIIGLQLSNEVAISIPILFSSISGCLLMAFFLTKLVKKRISASEKINLNEIIRSKFSLDLLKFSYPLMFVTIIGTAMHWMDIYMLGFFYDSTTVGMYHPPARTAGLMRMILIAFMGIFSPIQAELYSNNDRKNMVHVYHLVIRWIMTLALPLFLLIILFPKKLMFLFGPQYQESHMILSILTTAVLIQTFIGIGGPTLTMTGYPKINFINSIFILLINFALNIYLIPLYKGMGAAIATLISMTSLGLIRSIEIWYFLRLQPMSLKLIKPFLAIFVVMIMMISIRPLIIPFHTIISLIIASVIIGLSFVFLLWLIGFDKDDKQVISAIKMMFVNNK